MNGVCNKRVEDRKCIHNFGRKTRRKKHSEDLGVDGRIALERIGYEVVDWIHLA
jgi:hypothetical protein